MQRTNFTSHDQKVMDLKGQGTVFAKNAERAITQPHSAFKFPTLMLLIAGNDNCVSQALENAALKIDEMGYGGYDGAILKSGHYDSSYNVRACFSLDSHGDCSNAWLNQQRIRYESLHRIIQRTYENDGFNGGAQVALICLDENTLWQLNNNRNYRQAWIKKYLYDEKLNGKLLFIVTNDATFDFKNSRLCQHLCAEHPALVDCIAGGIYLSTHATANQICDSLINQMIPMIHDKAFGYETASLLDTMPPEVTYHITTFLPQNGAHPFTATNNWYRLFTQAPQAGGVPGPENNQDQDNNPCRIL